MTPQQVLAIRAEWDARTINVRLWADALKCSPETIRKVGRRDTYRDVAEGPSPAHQSAWNPPPATLAAPAGQISASAARLAELQRQIADEAVEELVKGSPLDE